ncbi:MAG: hypothetical protein ABFS24_11520 [Pseudomonadota bacterium]
MGSPTEYIIVPQAEYTAHHHALARSLANLGHIIAPNTVKNILKRHGIEPATERETHFVEDFLESALGRDGRHGFLYG